MSEIVTIPARRGKAILLGAGADINTRTRNGKRALTYAINWEREEIAAIMTEQGALE